jgi:hypothetical protein
LYAARRGGRGSDLPLSQFFTVCVVVDKAFATADCGTPAASRNRARSPGPGNNTSGLKRSASTAANNASSDWSGFDTTHLHPTT